ncbi:MAG: hypothetical protein Q9217_000541 [Psora testacea]
MRRVVITGLGAVTPLGLGVKQTWTRLLNAHCGIVSLRNRKAYDVEQQHCQVAGLVPCHEWEDAAKQHFTEDERRRTAKFMKFGGFAAKEALNDADWYPQMDLEQERTGICLGSGIGSLETVYDTSVSFRTGGAKKVSPLFVPKLLINLAAGHISMKYGLKGPSHAATTACTTGAHSIGDAARFIAFGDADVMLAGGAESCIHPLAFVGFERSRSLTTSYNDRPQEASRPFDKGRDGFVIGEGAAVLVLEELQHALDRKAKIYAEVLGYGASSDAYHLTAPPIDGNGALRAMKLALKHAQVNPSTVDYINAHATSTPLGDLAENRAITALMLGEFGKGRAEDINVSSTKGAIGHLLGAAGAIEAIFSVLAISDGVMPPTLNLRHVDCGEGFECNYVPLEKQEGRVRVVLSNSFGFGGTNASLCLRRFEG